MNTVTSTKWRRFRRNPIAITSVVLLAVIYVLSLASELICNSKPLIARANGRTFFPAFSFVSENDLVGNGVVTTPDYSKFCREHGEVRALFAPSRFGPRDIVDASDLSDYRRIRATYKPEVKSGRIDIRADLTIAKSENLDMFIRDQESGDRDQAAQRRSPTIERQTPAKDAVLSVTNLVVLPYEFSKSIASRFANQPSPAFAVTLPGPRGMVELSLLAYEERPNPPRTVRIRIRDAESEQAKPATVWFDRAENGDVIVTAASRKTYEALDVSVRDAMIAQAKVLSEAARQPGNGNYDSGDGREGAQSQTSNVTTALEPVTWPFRPVKGHPMGIDNAGRDVFARVLYGTRTAMTFGLVLVAWALAVGIVVGALQGYFGGWVDLGGQRFIEIWSALPFLYVMILVGSVFGRSFGLLLLCYGLFNWIGISYYVRAEFLRLRSRPFVEAAKCQGLGTWRIILRHMLPNALTPLITLLPFNLVGAIASISALDFLGFGLPPLTPSWGELLSQAQQNTSAWWLILYPSIMLFSTMLLSVFIGEGLRDAFDPKPKSRYS